MKLSQLRDVKELSIELDIDFKELVENLESENDDFELGDYRFISNSEIDINEPLVSTQKEIKFINPNFY